jgi:hypothetical protein
VGGSSRERLEARYLTQPEVTDRGPWQPASLLPCRPCNPAIPAIFFTTGEGERTRVGDEHEFSIPAGQYLVGQEFGAGEGGSLESEDRQ